MTRARDVANLIGSGNYSSTTFTATAGQTAFTISHTQGFVQVFMNGLLLDETVDYTSNGSAVTLTSGAAAGDEIEVVAYNTFSVGDALPKSGGTMSGALTVDAAAATVLTVDRATSDGDIIDIQRGGTSAGKIGGTSNVLSIVGKDGDGGIAIQNNSFGDIIYPASNLTGGASDNAIDLGYNNGRWKDLYLSGGAYLGGTGSANKLSDYEKGTWTPVAAGSSGTAFTYGEQQGHYIKVGDMVTAWFNLTNINGSASGHARINGLPFAANWMSGFNGDGVSGVLGINGFSNIEGLAVHSLINDAGSSIYFYHHYGTNNSVDTVDAQHKTSNSADVRGFVTYYVGG
mgnify:CR=1 FL=1